MMEVVEIEKDGKMFKFYVGELTWGDIQDIKDECFIVKGPNDIEVKTGKLQLMLLHKSIRKVENENGRTVKWTINDTRNLSPKDAAKIFEVADKINNFEDLFRY